MALEEVLEQIAVAADVKIPNPKEKDGKEDNSYISLL
jgi:hypothetical protein